MDLVFSPEGVSGGGSCMQLWQDPLIRWTTAAMLDIIAGPPGCAGCATGPLPLTNSTYPTSHKTVQCQPGKMPWAEIDKLSDS